MKTHIYFVYILKCSDGTYYTGVTNDVNRRFAEHRTAKDTKSYTFKRKPLKLMFFAEFSNIDNAIEKEKQLKT